MGQKPKALTPEAGAAHLLGAEMRAWRMKRGLSLAALGTLIHLDRSHLARMERAERPAPLEVLEGYDQALCTEGALTRLHRSLPTPHGHVANHGADVATPASTLAT